MTVEDYKKWADELKAELDAANFESAHHYQYVKDLYWRILARSKGTTSRKLNPMNFWFGGQSN